MKRLQISPQLSLPADAVTQKLAFLARTGAGKTYAAMKLCEEMLDAGAQVVALDPVGVWYGLRLAADGKGDGFTIPVFGGEHGDVPLEPKAGALVADLVVDRSISAVLDVSMFESKAQHKQFATDFAERLFFRKKSARSPLHLFLEEAQEFVPQFKARGEERMLGAFERLIKLGRNYGLGASLISQRPQAVNKDVLNQTECLFALQTTGPQERKAIAGWIKEKGVDDDIDALLPKLKIGEARVWSPQWLGVSETVQIGKKRTYDASATPTFGERAAPVRKLSPVDVDEIRQSMAEVVERAESNDPDRLRRRIAELEKELRTQQSAKPLTEVKTVEIPVLKEEQVARIESLVADAQATAASLEGAAEDLHAAAKEVRDALRAAASKLADAPPRILAGQTPGQNARKSLPPQPVAQDKKRDNVTAEGGEANVPRAWQVLLDGLAWYRAIGLESVTRNQLATFVQQSAGGGAFQNKLGAMRSDGLVHYPAHNYVALTGSGARQAKAPDHTPTLAELHAQVRNFLPPAQWKLLKLLIDIHPDACTRDELAKAAEESAGGGAFQNKLGRLRTLGFIDYPQSGYVVATDILFPEGLS